RRISGRGVAAKTRRTAGFLFWADRGDAPQASRPGPSILLKEVSDRAQASARECGAATLAIIPAQAGIQSRWQRRLRIPAFAGMTPLRRSRESGNPAVFIARHWIPARAGMTHRFPIAA